MNADLTLTAYDKQTKYLIGVMVLPMGLAEYSRRIAGVPPTDPDILGVYPLTAQQAAEIAGQADLVLDTGDYDDCLETIAHEEHPVAHRA